MKTSTLWMIAFLLGACSPQIRVYTDHDPDYDVKSFKTFDWHQNTNIEQGRNPLYYNELTDKRIKEAIGKELTGRGYINSSRQPDLTLHYHIVVDDQSVLVTEPFGCIYSPNWIHEQTQVYAYREGTLIVDIMHAESNHLIWRGWAVSDLDVLKDPDQTADLIKRSVEKIFKHFPNASSQGEIPVASSLEPEQ
jgi:hypothetical protein